MSIIRIRDLSHRFYDGTWGISAINLSVAPGEFLILAGANGSGKSTLLRHINGLLLPQSGEVWVMGELVAKNPALARQRVGMVFQDADSQIIGETVQEDVAFGPENLKLDRQTIGRRVQEALAAVGLTHLADKSPYHLSGGQKRRLAIAGILAMGSNIFLFDEPFSNLDYPGVRQVLTQIHRLHQAGHTVLLTTHDLEKALALADRLVLMEKGRIARDGPPHEILPEVERFGVRAPCAVRGAETLSWLNG